MREFAIQTRKLNKLFGSFTANRDLSINVTRGSIHGLVGENGAGKSTLLKILFGIYQPSSGEIMVNGTKFTWHSPLDAIQAGLGMVQQHFALVDSLTALDNIILGAEPVGLFGKVDRGEALKRIKDRLPSASLEVAWNEPVANLSVGDRQRTEILKLLYRDANILFLDEPTAVLTPQETTDLLKVLKLLKLQGKTIIFVSHKFSEVLEICDEVTVLRRGEAVWSGRLEKSVAPAQIRDELVTAMMGHALVPVSKERAPVRADAALALTFKDVVNVEKGRDTLAGVSFQLRHGEILGVAGVSGSGQKALIEIALGLTEYQGQVQCLGRDVRECTPLQLRRLGIGLIPEERLGEGLWGNESIAHNLIVGLEPHFQKPWLTTLGIFDEPAILRSAAIQTAQFDVRYQELNQFAASLSGGNQQKVIFAREIDGRKPKLLICFNPSRGVDLGAVQFIHEELKRLRTTGVGILYISHELDELMEICDRMMVLCEGQRTALFDRGEFSREAIGHAMSGRQT
jgi:ABC-type uncharacterized transport system ATPase subunit